MSMLVQNSSAHDTGRQPEVPKILIVDDEAPILSSLSRMLRDCPYDITYATSGDEALRLAMLETYAVVVSDSRMPIMDGVTLLHRIRECSPQTVRVLLTGYADMGLAIKAINHGEIFRLLTKPWQEDELLLALEQSVARHEAMVNVRALPPAGETDTVCAEVVDGEVVVRLVNEPAGSVGIKNGIRGKNGHPDAAWQDVLGSLLRKRREAALRQQFEEMAVGPGELCAGMVLSRDLMTSDGVCLLRSNTVLRKDQTACLRRILEAPGGAGEVWIYRQISFERQAS